MTIELSNMLQKYCMYSPAAYALLFLILVSQSAIAQQTFTGSDGVEVTIADTTRIISIGSAVTETIYALGADENLIAADESSTYPEAAEALPKVSFTRNLSPEGVLSFSPTVILASGASGPEAAIRQIRSTGTPMLLFTADETVEGAFERVEQLGKVLNREAEASQIIENMKEDLTRAEKMRKKIDEKPKVLFIYARGPNNLMVAGNKTSAKTVIELAGGVNAFTEFDGYKPLTAEAVVNANPDVILMMDSGIQSVGGEEGVLKSPGVELTNAAKNSRIYSMEGTYLIGFSPRLGSAVLDLMQLLHSNEDFVEMRSLESGK